MYRYEYRYRYCTRSNPGIIGPDFAIFGGPRKFEGTDDVCALSSHTSIESRERWLFSDVQVGIP